MIKLAHTCHDKTSYSVATYPDTRASLSIVKCSLSPSEHDIFEKISKST